uniref:CASP C-terminal domain-containing protein n=1 Tax=Chlamydomonas euryale TaxID=1486919 RepID=A0A7R9V294_9CHLO|mmetsp:Transcript_14441/g.42056  ORF Transcript_14441/g.42056 Transcript_14441/m.42056 type:complete len:235 (+) Transcript_14441:991-1695(+)
MAPPASRSHIYMRPHPPWPNQPPTTHPPTVRFRAKATELGEQLAAARAQLAAATAALEASKVDNIALVERMRYVQGFHPHNGGGSGAPGGAPGVAVQQKYERIYDEQHNPFKEFQGQQAERQRQRLHVVDRAMYKMGRMVYGNAPARAFAFVYLSVLHLLVAGVLFRMGHHSSGQLHAHHQAVLNTRHDVAGHLHHDRAHAAAAAAGDEVGGTPGAAAAVAAVAPALARMLRLS